MSNREHLKTIPRAESETRDVRQALIDEAIAMLSEGGPETLTLRKVAARVGVSHAAPAHHFRGLPHLLGAVCSIGFEKLAAEIQARMDTATTDPREQLLALCEGYIGFARANPGLTSLMFNTDRTTVDKASMAEAGQSAYRLLKEVCAPFEPVGQAEDSTETLIWSLVHGMAFLHIGGRFDNPGRTTGNPELRDILPSLQLREE